MKRLIVVIAGLLVMPAFAEVAPEYIADDVVEYTDADDAVVTDVEVSTDDMPKAKIVQSASNVVATRNANARGAATRAVPTRSTNGTVSRAMPSGGRAISARSAVVGNATATMGTNAAVGRATVTRNGRGAAVRSANVKDSTVQNVSTRRMNATTQPAVQARAATLTTSNNSLYNANARVGVAVASRAPMARSSGIGSAINVTATNTATATDTTTMDELAQLSDYCKAQYQSCMDNYCNVLDDNQGRCTCSKNLKNYEKTAAALKEATMALQDVAQQIQYIGLSADEIETLFTQTAAEDAMNGKNDNSSLKTSLDNIKDMIVDIKTGKAAVSDNNNGMSLDFSGLLNFNIDSTGFDLGSLFGTSSNTETISNQRGETLYKTATSRCKAAVLNNCTAQGVDANVITNAYDLEIDKQCIAYERQLSDSNDQMTATVRNAKTVLQKARLMVAQQKNQYDLRACVNALDSCMQDDFVCGDDYEKCLDPTGKYIVDGAIVVGGTPGAVGSTDGVYATWKYTTSGKQKNVWSSSSSIELGDVSDYINTNITSSAQTESSVVMANFLAYKIGYNDSGKNYGMCISVLNKCQDYTYENGGYKADNTVIKEYLARTMTTIKAKQDSIIADYAGNCQSDVQSCLSTNGFDVSKETAGATTITNDKNKLATNACKSIITTCASVNGATGSLSTTTLGVDPFVLATMKGE
ncbi:MAG: hypothetical protein MJ187_03140 [Alphaproteobacteria bacterium]|nr:hypothetical protein [Alphaproteobacteria bacterium]